MYKELLDICERLEYTIDTAHVDMGGNHRYTLSIKSHDVIKELKEFLRTHKGTRVMPISYTVDSKMEPVIVPQTCSHYDNCLKCPYYRGEVPMSKVVEHSIYCALPC